MGAQFSRNIFEYCNEVFIAIGSGVPGLVLLFQNRTTAHLFRIISIVGITTCSLLYVCAATDTATVTPQKVVIITGCDTGLGFSLAQEMTDMGFTVLATFMKLDSYGALEMKKLYDEPRLFQLELDVTQKASVDTTVSIIDEYFKNNPDQELWALVNNAGVMVFGEFEWLTENLIQRQININLFGTIRFTKALMPTLRKHYGTIHLVYKNHIRYDKLLNVAARIITVTSHCALATLPGLSVYGATKAAVQAWSDGLRVEVNKYGIKVVTFIPGSFANQSHIMSHQVENVYEMHSEMTTEQHKFYGDYFKRYNSYLSGLQTPKVPRKIEDESMYSTFKGALLDDTPKSIYINEPLRYAVYHKLFKYAPVRLRDYLVVKFMQMPEYVRNSNPLPEAIA